MRTRTIVTLGFLVSITAACSKATTDDAGSAVPGESDAGDAAADVVVDATTDATLDAPNDDAGDAGTDAAPSCIADAAAPDAIAEPVLHAPRWAFEPWISKDISTGPDTYDFVDGFQSRDIPVGVVVLDSPWETNYDTFEPNPTRYPNFPTIVSDMHAKDVRVVLWITGFVNSLSFDLETGGDKYPNPSPHFQEGEDCGYFVNDGAQYSWWKGKGASIDFFSPGAVAWMRAQQDGVLAAGIDGWKLDFGDSYVTTDTVKTAAGDVPHQRYSEEYYREFLRWGVHRNGREFATLTRAWDESYQFAGRFFAAKEDAPIAWMGDNRRDWIGLADALNEMMLSSNGGYAVLGSDVGGYLDRDDKDLLGPTIPLDEAVFSRWVAVGALSPFMQLHGRANLTPWTFPTNPDAVTARYRYWAKLHHALVPFFYSLAEDAASGGPMLVRPVGTSATWTGDFSFGLGDAFFVAPILDATGVRDVLLPPSARFVDWFAQDQAPLDGGATLSAYDATDLAKLPLFLRSGAIVPLAIEDDVLGLGTAASKGKLTLLVYPDIAASTFRLHDEDDAVTTIGTQQTGGGFSVTLSRALRDTLVRVRAETLPSDATLDGTVIPTWADRAAFDAATTGWFYEAATKSAWVHVPAGAGTRTIGGT